MDTLDTLAERLVDASLGRLREVLERSGAALGEQLRTKASANISARLKERSGALLRTVRPEVEVSGDTLTVRLLAGGDYQGLRVPYARLQEYGGTVLPVRAKHLAIPVEHGLTDRKTPKYASPRQMPFAAFRPARPGSTARWIVYDKRNGQVFFVLVTHSVIPEQRYLRDAMDDVVRTVPEQLAQMAAQLVVGGA
jgi:hypothetical protein